MALQKNIDPKIIEHIDDHEAYAFAIVNTNKDHDFFTYLKYHPSNVKDNERHRAFNEDIEKLLSYISPHLEIQSLAANLGIFTIGGSPKILYDLAQRDEIKSMKVSGPVIFYL